MNRLSMTCRAGFLLIAAVMMVLPRNASASVVIEDDTGSRVSLDQPARRIIPLYGAFAEMLFTIGAGDRLVGRTQADQYPPGIEKLPSVGTHMRPNIEMIIGFKPDLVIQSATRGDTAVDLERLRAAGIPVAVFAPRTFEGIFSTMTRLGILAGKEKEAGKVVSGLEERLKEVKKRRSGAGDVPRVFFEIRAEPLTGAGQGSIVDRIIEAAGGINVLRNERAIVQYSLEALLLEAPDFYVVQVGPMNRNPVDPAKRTHFDRLKAVRGGRVMFADEFIFSRPGPRCVDAVEQLADMLHPTGPRSVSR